MQLISLHAKHRPISAQMEGNGAVPRSGSLGSTAGSTDTKVTTISAQSDWETPLMPEAKANFVSLNPVSLFLAFRNAHIVTVEPVVFLYMLGTFLYFPLYQQYYYLRYGLDQLKETNFTIPNSSFCLNSSEIDEYGGNGTYKIVENLSSNLLTYGSLCNRLLSLIATLIIGPLSDRYGRRLVIIIVAMGMLLQGIISLFIVHFNLSLYFFLVTQAIAGITGDFAAMLMACFTYVVDVSSVRWRTLRIAIAEAMLFLAGSMGEGLISGLWLQKLNCYFIPPIWVFIACALGIIGYTIVFLPESLSYSERQKQSLKKQNKFQTLVTGIKILFCRYKGLAVWKLWCGLFTVFILVCNMAGATQLNVYYFKAKLSLDWDPETTGFYLALQQLSCMVALLGILPFFIACKLPDALIAIFGLVANCIVNVVVGLASYTYQLFIVAAVGGFQSVMLPPLRSLMSKEVPDDKQGAIFAFVASVELLGSLVSGVSFPQLFKFTLNHNLPPGTIYFMMAALALIPLPIMLLLLFCGKSCTTTSSSFGEKSEDTLRSHPHSPTTSEYYPPAAPSSEKDALLSAQHHKSTYNASNPNNRIN